MHRINRFLLLLFATLLAFTAGAGQEAQASPSGDELVVKAARIYTLAGQAGYVDDAWMHLRSGRVVKVGTGPAPEVDRVIDLGDAHIIPGLIASNLGSARSTIEIGAAYVSADRFNPFARQDDLLESRGDRRSPCGADESLRCWRGLGGAFRHR